MVIGDCTEKLLFVVLALRTIGLQLILLTLLRCDASSRLQALRIFTSGLICTLCPALLIARLQIGEFLFADPGSPFAKIN